MTIDYNKLQVRTQQDLEFGIWNLDLVGYMAKNKKGAFETCDNGIPDSVPPIIDFSLLNSSPSSPQPIHELSKFRSSLASWGCFQLMNHGISSVFLDEMREVSKQFFALPMEEKRKYQMAAGGKNGFWSGAASADTDSSQQLQDWNDRLSLTVYPQHRRELKFWPDKPPHLREMLHEYTMKFSAIFDVLFKMVLNSLDVDDGTFAERHGKNKEINAAINIYPRCPNPDHILGLKPHADFSSMTIVLQDEPGLEVLKDDSWFMVPVVPDGVFVNIGDPIEIMSNGIFKSAVHRVVTSTKKARVSVILFWDSDRDNEIGPLEELITADQPQRYETISHKDYVVKFFGDYALGRRPIDSVKI